MRATGKLPAVLYGHGEDPVNLTVAADQLRSVLRHGGHVVDLDGAVSGQALVQDTQWDTFGSHLLHVDLLRVDAKEVLHVEVAVELKGDAAGEREGGIVEQTLQTVEVECSAAAVPEKLILDVTELHLNGSLTAGDFKDLPEGVKVSTDPSALVVHCVPPAGEPDQDGVTAAPGEPELVGGKPSDDEGS